MKICFLDLILATSPIVTPVITPNKTRVLIPSEIPVTTPSETPVETVSILGTFSLENSPKLG